MSADSLHEKITAWDADWAGRFPKRIRRREKEQFLNQLEQEMTACNFETERPELRNLFQNRLLLTRCEKPAVIFLAHFDTPTIMPFWVSAFFRVLGHTRQISGGILLILILYAPILLSPFPPFNQPPLQPLISLFYILLGLSMLSLFIPNPHNRDDNTSGVIGLLALAHWLKDQPHLRGQVQFVFLDNEEWGLLGSSALKQHWDKTGHPYQEAAVINLDCISRGPIPLLVHHGRDTIAQRLAPYLQKHFPQTKLLNLGILPLSDNYTFKKTGAVDISFADPSTIPGGYHIPRIHTPADNDFNPQQVTHLIECLTDFLANELEMETP